MELAGAIIERLQGDEENGEGLFPVFLDSVLSEKEWATIQKRTYQIMKLTEVEQLH